MTHTECEDCKLRNGDCGYHFKSFGKTNYDIPSITALDKYGNCEFFQQKEKPQGDLISRKFVNELVCAEFVDLQDGTEEWRSYVNDTCESILEKIDNAPTVEYTFEEAFQKTICEQKLYCPARPKGNWIIDGHHIRCNRCNEYICNTDREGNKIPDNFCPNCGADMRKGAEE